MSHSHPCSALHRKEARLMHMEALHECSTPCTAMRWVCFACCARPRHLTGISHTQ
jgi:hypothetical protein